MAILRAKNEVINYSPDDLKDFHLYMYEWIDNLYFVRKPQEFLSNAEEYITVASSLFLEAGWEGDGEIGLIWIPPFVHLSMADDEEAWGTIVWHVKQLEDGISWLLSPKELSFGQSK